MLGSLSTNILLLPSPGDEAKRLSHTISFHNPVSFTMFSKDDFYTFVYGQKVGNSKAPLFLSIRSSNAFIISTISMAVFTDIFLYSLVVPVLPFALTGRAGVEEKNVQ